jgi:hypothetical protein
MHDGCINFIEYIIRYVAEGAFDRAKRYARNLLGSLLLCNPAIAVAADLAVPDLSANYVSSRQHFEGIDLLSMQVVGLHWTRRHLKNVESIYEALYDRKPEQHIEMLGHGVQKYDLTKALLKRLVDTDSQGPILEFYGARDDAVDESIAADTTEIIKSMVYGLPVILICERVRVGRNSAGQLVAAITVQINDVGPALDPETGLSNEIHVWQLPKGFESSELHALLSEKGVAGLEYTMAREPHSGLLTGHATVRYQKREQATFAIQILNGLTYKLTTLNACIGGGHIDPDNGQQSMHALTQSQWDVIYGDRIRTNMVQHGITITAINRKHASGLALTLDVQPQTKSILRMPTKRFPEEHEPIREGVAPHKDALIGKDVPIGARLTRIDRRLVNLQALEEAQERFEERMDCVIVLRVLTKEEIQKLADRTKKIRERRGLSAPLLLDMMLTTRQKTNTTTTVIAVVSHQILLEMQIRSFCTARDDQARIPRKHLATGNPSPLSGTATNAVMAPTPTGETIARTVVTNTALIARRSQRPQMMTHHQTSAHHRHRSTEPTPRCDARK